MLPLRKILSNKRSGKSGGLSSAEVTSASDDYGTPETVQVHWPSLRPFDIQVSEQEDIYRNTTPGTSAIVRQQCMQGAGGGFCIRKKLLL